MSFSRKTMNVPTLPSRCDVIWIAIPLALPPLLIAFGRPPNPFTAPAALEFVMACLMIPLSGFLVWRSMESPSWRKALPLAALCLIAAIPCIYLHSFGPLQALFVLYFAGLSAWRMLSATGSSIAGLRPGIVDYLMLTKPALSAMVLAPVLIGFILASPRPIDVDRLVLLLTGVALLAGGAGASNQFMERGRDRRMRRTARRPLPAGRMDPLSAARFGGALALSGMLVLGLLVDLSAAWLATLSYGIYVHIYTPMKRTSPLATLVGAVSGAVPPLLGWFAAGGGVSPAALTLFSILYLWQIPHFLAIAWKYREEYRAAGFRLYGVLDPTGRATGLQALLYTLALLPVSLTMSWHGLAGLQYMFGAFALGVGLIAYAGVFALRPDCGHARRLFIATIVYLPILLISVLVDH